MEADPRCLLLNKGILRVCCGFSMAHLCVGVISLTLQNSFVEIGLLHGYSPVGLLHVCRACFLEKASRGLLLNKDNFLYSF